MNTKHPKLEILTQRISLTFPDSKHFGTATIVFARRKVENARIAKNDAVIAS